MKLFSYLALFCLCYGGASSLFAEEEARPDEAYFQKIQEQFEKKDWEHVFSTSQMVARKYPNFEKMNEMYYYWAISAFHLEDYGKANECFTKYLDSSITPRFFEEVILHKFLIAESFREGKKQHLFGWRAMPRWMPSRSDALEIYDEIIASLPHHELAARSLFGKGQLLSYFEDFKASIDTLELLIQRFPKHNLAMDGYLEIGKVYLMMARSKQQDPTLIDQSAVNLKKFRMAFNADAKIVEAEQIHKSLKDAFAENMYDMAEFFSKRHKEVAAELYYKRILSTFPESECALKASRELEKMGTKEIQ